MDFDFYDVNAFNQCENNNCVLMAVPKWQYVHPLLKILPVDWNYTIPYGLLHSLSIPYGEAVPAGSAKSDRAKKVIT